MTDRYERFKHLAAAQLPGLGIDPPSEPVYTWKEPWGDLEPRICTSCGNLHYWGVKNTATGEFKMLDICEPCQFKGVGFKADPPPTLYGMTATVNDHILTTETGESYDLSQPIDDNSP